MNTLYNNDNQPMMAVMSRNRYKYIQNKPIHGKHPETNPKAAIGGNTSFLWVADNSKNYFDANPATERLGKLPADCGICQYTNAMGHASTIQKRLLLLKYLYINIY